MADSDDNEMSGEEEEYDTIQYSDDEGDPSGNEQDDDELPENHGKMVAFHAAIKAVLERQLDKMQGEVRETGRLVVIGVEETEEAARKLHDVQKKLVLEEDNVRVFGKKLDKSQTKREKREKENKSFKQDVEKYEYEIEQKNLNNDELRTTVNELSGQSLHLQAQRLNIENEVGVDQACTDKGEEDFKGAQEAKQAQDKYVGRLSEEVEQLDGMCSQYQSQSASMDQGTDETMENVRKAENEIKFVKSEESKMVTNWTNTVININKRDEALANFREAIDNQKIEMKNVKTTIEGAKDDILGCQAEHEQLTGIYKRVHKLAINHNGAIKKIERFTTEEKLELGRLGRVRNESEDVLLKTEAEVKNMEYEEAALRSKVEKSDNEKRALEEEVMDILRDQMSTERSSTSTDRRVREVRQLIKELETEQGETSNRLAELEGEIAVAKLRLEEEQQKIARLSVSSKLLLHQENESRSNLEKTIVAIDKIQNLIDIGTKLKAKLLEKSGGEEISPLEADIKKHREELTELINYCATAKRQWTKMQNVLIKAHLDKDETKQEFEQSKNKFFILEEKKLSNESEIRNLSIDLAKLKKRIEHFDINIKKLNSIVADERIQIENLEDSRVNKSEENIAKVTDIEEMIEDLKDNARKMEVTRHFTVEKVRESDRELFEWEDKVKACKETSDFLSEERAKDSELENMKCEVHFLDQRMKDLARATGELISSLEDHAIRRESIYEKINTEQASELEKKREKVGKTMVAKKITDLKNNIKKLCSEAKHLEKTIEEAKARYTEINDTLNKMQNEAKKMSKEIHHTEDQHLEAQDEKEVRLNAVIQYQTKAKWYESVKNKQYKVQKHDDPAAELNKIAKKNGEIRDVMKAMIGQYPAVAGSIRRASNMLVNIQT